MPTTDGPPAAAPVDETASQPDKLLTRTTLAVGAIVVALLIRRLRFGVDLTDEAFYVAMPYRFFVGDGPFVDEILIHQTAALMSYPLVAGFVEATGGTDGIVLFLRHAHLVFSLGIAGSVAWVLTNFARWQHAALIGLACAAFVPFCIPTLSYNTLGIGFFTIGILLGSLAVVHPHAPRAPALGGALLALAVLAYPPLGLPAFVHVFATWWLARNRAGRAALGYGAAFAIACSAVAAMLATHGIDNIVRSIEATSMLGAKGGGSEKLIGIVTDFFYFVVLQPVPLGLAWLLRYGSKSASPALAPWLPGIALLMPLSLATVVFEQTSVRGLWQVLHLALATPLLLCLGAFSEAERRLCGLVLLASAIAAAIIAYTSANGLINAGLGALPAALLGLLALVRACERGFGATLTAAQQRQVTLALAAAPAIAFLVVMLSTYSTTTYSSPAPKTSHLTSRIEHGPFAGIYTYSNRARVVNEMQADLAQHVAPSDTILFMDDLPAGYLMTRARSATNSAWTPSFGLSPRTSGVLFDYYERSGVRPSLIMTRGPTARRDADPLLQWADRDFEIIETRRGHTLYRAKGAPQRTPNPMGNPNPIAIPNGPDGPSRPRAELPRS